MRRFTTLLMLCACSSKPAEPSPAEVQRAFEQQLVADIKAARPGASTSVTSTEVQIVAQPDTCKELLAVAMKPRGAVPPGQGVACGVAGDRPAWRLREHAGQLVDVGPESSGSMKDP